MFSSAAGTRARRSEGRCTRWSMLEANGTLLLAVWRRLHLARLWRVLEGSFEREMVESRLRARQTSEGGASKNKKSTVLRAAAGGRGSNPLADLWELADECGKLPDPV